MGILKFNRQARGYFAWEYAMLGILFLGALAVRLYIVYHTYLISKDGIIYVDMAKKFAQGDFKGALSYAYHPLYSILVAFFQKIFGNWVLTSQIVSSFLGALTIFPLYFLGKRTFGPKAAGAGALLYIFSTYAARFSADSLSEATYLFFFISAIAVGLAAVESKLIWKFAAAGALSALAYLTRPEGVGLLIIISIWSLIPFGEKILARRHIASLFAVALAFLVLSSPYLFYLRSANGSFSLTKKKEIMVLIGVGDSAYKANGLAEGKSKTMGQGAHPSGEDSGDAPKNVQSAASDKNETSKRSEQSGPFPIVLGQVYLVLASFIETLSYLLFALFLFGLSYRKRAPRSWKEELYLASAFVLYFPVLFRLLQTYSYTSRRYYLPLAALALLWCGAGLGEAHEALLSRLKKYKVSLAPNHAIALFVALAILPVLVLAPMTIRSNRSYKMADKEVALWIEKNGPKGAAIMSSDPRLAFYAGGVHINLPKADKDYAVKRVASSGKLDYIVLETNDGGGPGPNDWIKHLDGDLRLVYVSEALRRDGRTKMAVYQLRR